jgi:hypothetical protein
VTEQILTAVSTAGLFTAVFALKFRYWNRPYILGGYFAFFGTLEWICHVHLLPAGAFGPWLYMLCFALIVPVVIAIVLLSRHEHKMNEVSG